MPFIGEAHCDPIFAEAPKFFDQSVVEFPCPLSGKKRNDGGASLNKFGAVSPGTVGGIGERHFSWIARVPPILGRAHLFNGRVVSKGRQWRAALRHGLLLVRVFS